MFLEQPNFVWLYAWSSIHHVYLLLKSYSPTHEIWHWLQPLPINHHNLVVENKRKKDTPWCNYYKKPRHSKDSY